MGEDLSPGAHLTTKQVAALLHVSRMTVTRWAEDGHLPYVELPSGRRRFTAEDVEEFIASRRRAGDAA